MLTVTEAARRSGRNPETIRRWIRSGRLRARKMGNQHVIEDRDLAAAASGPSDTLPVPDGWKRTMTGEPMPDVVGAIRRQRASH